jgi:hypothetical protein
MMAQRFYLNAAFIALFFISQAQAWGLSISSLLFKPRNLVLEKSLGDEDTLKEAGLFFTQAFWYVRII